MVDKQIAPLPVDEFVKDNSLQIYLLCVSLLFVLSLVDAYSYKPLLQQDISGIIVLVFLMFGGLVGSILYASFFAVWCLPALEGENRIPIRSIILLLVMAGLTMLHFITGWKTGLQHHGLERMIFLAELNSGFILALTGVWLLAKKRGGMAVYFIFHFLMFAWIRFGFIPSFEPITI